MCTAWCSKKANLADKICNQVLCLRHVDGSQYPIVNITVQWKDLGYKPDTKAAVRDLFAAEELGVWEENLTLSVDLHDARMVKITPEKHEGHHEDWRPWKSSSNRSLQTA